MNKLLLERLRPIVQLSQCRTFKSDLKIKWVRPEKIPCYKPAKSGDLASFPQVDKSMLALEYQQSKELESANELVKKLFTLEYLPDSHTKKYVQKVELDKVRRHDMDFGSMEARIARQTARIRALQKYMDEFPRNAVIKVQLKELIDKRKKFLKYLRRWDYRRFEFVLEKLDIVYKPPPAEFHWITRKDSLRKLTDIHCDNIREERLKAYREELESKHLEFLQKKLENLKFIRQEQIECKVPVTVSEEDITNVEKQLKQLEIQKNDQSNVNS